MDTVVGYIYSVFCPILEPKVIGILFLIVIVVLIIYSIRHNRNNFALDGDIIFYFSSFNWYLCFLLFFPIFHKRYLLPLLGTFWLKYKVF